MATAGPPPGMPPPEVIQQLIQAEATKRGMTIPQFQAWQKQQIEQEAARLGMTPQAFVQMKQAEMQKQQQMQQQAQAQGGQVPGQPQQQRPGASPQGQQQVTQIPLNAQVEAKPEALAVAKFLRSQDLKTRTCILDGQRRDMFKGRQTHNL
jgi:translocation protein SEC62